MRVTDVTCLIEISDEGDDDFVLEVNAEGGSMTNSAKVDRTELVDLYTCIEAQLKPSAVEINEAMLRRQAEGFDVTLRKCD